MILFSGDRRLECFTNAGEVEMLVSPVVSEWLGHLNDRSKVLQEKNLLKN